MSTPLAGSRRWKTSRAARDESDHRRRALTKCLVEKLDTQPVPAADIVERGRSPLLCPHHLGKHAEMHRDHLPLMGQLGDRLHYESLLVFCRGPRGRRQCGERGPKAVRTISRAVDIEQFHRGAIGILRKPDVEHPEKPCDRHPEVVADNQQSTDPAALALTKCPDQLWFSVISLACSRSELVDHEEQLPVVIQSLAAADRGQQLGEGYLGREPGAFRRHGGREPPLGLGGRRLKNTEMTDLASRGSRPALTSDEFRTPRGRKAGPH